MKSSMQNKTNRLARQISRMQIIAREPDHKSWLRIWLELNSRKVRKDIKKSGYMALRIYRTDADNLQDYISQEKWHHILTKVCDPEMVRIFDDKVAFQDCMETADFPMPRVYGTYKNGQFELRQNNQRFQYTHAQVEEALAHLRAIGNGKIFAKVTNGSCGIGAFRLHQNMDNNEFIFALGQKDFLFQEDVEQHPEVSAFHPKSLNTLRLLTVLDDSGKAHVFGGLFRIGSGDNEVDNAYSGGYLNFLDLETGAFQDISYRNLKQNGYQTPYHLDSGLSFSGFTLPFFKEAHALVRRAAEKALPSLIIGWDIAIGPDGPILIEANRSPSHMSDQAMRGAYMQRPQLREALLRLRMVEGYEHRDQSYVRFFR